MTVNRAIIVLLVLAAGVIACLTFASPQTGKWVYLWQANVYPRTNLDEFGRIIVPANFDGVWRTWDSSGALVARSTYDKGVLVSVEMIHEDTGAAYKLDPLTARPSVSLPSGYTYSTSSIGRFPNGLDISIENKGKKVYFWSGDTFDNAVISADILYYPEYIETATGCALVRVDLRARKLDRCSLSGMGMVSHSKYGNRVIMVDHLSARTPCLLIYGVETAGSYVELVDVKAWRVVAHLLIEK